RAARCCGAVTRRAAGGAGGGGVVGVILAEDAHAAGLHVHVSRMAAAVVRQGVGQQQDAAGRVAEAVAAAEGCDRPGVGDVGPGERPGGRPEPDVQVGPGGGTEVEVVGAVHPQRDATVDGGGGGVGDLA